MPSTKILIDKWMEARSLPTLKAAARALGKAGASTVGNWMSGYAKPDDASIAKMCSQCGEDAAWWIAKLHSEFEEDPLLQKVWNRLAQVAAALVITVGLSIAAPSTAHASVGLSAHNQAYPVYYVKS